MTGDGSGNGVETGERVIGRLGEHGVEYVFSTFGTDHPTLIKGFAEGGGPVPVLASHEMVAASAAHGYAQVTGAPGVVLVHVDVGTANLGASVHNASRSRVPLVVLAGRTPLTTDGTRAGSRSIFVHWYQDVGDQHGIVREYSKWNYDLVVAENADSAVDRAVQVASAAPAGPVYLTLPREILRTPAAPTRALPATETRPGGVDAGVRDEILGLLEGASHPLVVTSMLGRDEAGVGALVEFAETVGVPVVETAPAFDLNFPRDHPLHHGFIAEEYFDTVDLLVVVDCDVPWVPKRGTPQAGATVVHIDADPEKPRYPMWDYPVDLRVRADARLALEALTEAWESGTGDERSDRFAEVGRERHADRRAGVPAAAEADELTPDVLSLTLGEELGEDVIVVDETVTNTLSVLEHTNRTRPGTYYSYCSSGLGWGLGAALGVQLARPEATVACLVGDGSFVLGNPVAAVQLANVYGLPHLVVVYNNAGWRAVANAIHDQYDEVGFDPDEFAAFAAESDYASLAEGLGCYGERITEPEVLPAAIERALGAVDDGTHTILDVAIT